MDPTHRHIHNMCDNCCDRSHLCTVCWRCRPMMTFIKNLLLSDSKKILKIGQHLAKLKTMYDGTFFTQCDQRLYFLAPHVHYSYSRTTDQGHQQASVELKELQSDSRHCAFHLLLSAEGLSTVDQNIGMSYQLAVMLDCCHSQ